MDQPTPSGSSAAASAAQPDVRITPSKAARTVVGGVLMGIANLIPGVSGGTMILAIGLYEDFIESVAGLTAFRWTAGRILFLVLLFAGAGVSIVGLSSVILFLLFRYSSLMYALFIGLTLGGAPLLWRMMGRHTPGAIAAAVAGVLVMAGVAMMSKGGQMPRNTTMDVVSGVVGSTTMVLPGISGSYMLLVMGQYDRVIGSISDLKDRDFSALRIIIPVGIGTVIGIVGLSNLLKVLLRRYAKVTLGFLLGLLLGSVLGLYPFGRTPTEKILQEQPEATVRQFAVDWGVEGADQLSGDVLVEHVIAGWPQRTRQGFVASELIGALVMLIFGFALTTLLGRMGSKGDAMVSDSPPHL